MLLGATGLASSCAGAASIILEKTMKAAMTVQKEIVGRPAGGKKNVATGAADRYPHRRRAGDAERARPRIQPARCSRQRRARIRASTSPERSATSGGIPASISLARRVTSDAIRALTSPERSAISGGIPALTSPEQPAMLAETRASTSPVPSAIAARGVIAETGSSVLSGVPVRLSRSLPPRFAARV